jgi:hypothetical protein
MINGVGGPPAPVQPCLSTVGARVLTVHLEPVRPPRVSSKGVRRRMDDTIANEAATRANTRASTQNPLFEADVASLVERAAASLSMPPAREGTTYLMTPLPPYERRFSHPESRRTHERKVISTSDEPMCGSLASPGYYSTGKSPRATYRSSAPSPEPLSDPTAWLQHEHPIDGAPETKPSLRMKREAYAKTRQTSLCATWPSSAR